MQLLIATTSSGKLLELRRLLDGVGVRLMRLDPSASTAGLETGTTFAENALLKARHYHRSTGLITVADDSGLSVDALDGAPGVHSARYAGAEATDGDRIAKLLGEMEAVPPESRTARFGCAAAIVWPGGEQVFTGAVEGTILKELRGANGFGYDPVFLYPPFARTFAELGPEEKANVSHRGIAFRRLARWIIESGVLDTSGADDRIRDPLESPLLPLSLGDL